MLNLLWNVIPKSILVRMSLTNVMLALFITVYDDQTILNRYCNYRKSMCKRNDTYLCFNDNKTILKRNLNDNITNL